MRTMAITDYVKMSAEERKEFREKMQRERDTFEEQYARRMKEIEAKNKARESQKVLDEVVEWTERKSK